MNPDPDTIRIQVADPHFPHMGSGEIRVSSEDDCICIQIFNPFVNGLAHVDVSDPEQIRHLAARLVVEAEKLQNRLEIQQGIGGDQ